MYQCPNCNGNLKFNIALQKLSCEHCDSKFGVHAFDAAEDTNEDSYEVTVFTCPQCGGELYTTDTSATSFCSFCGVANILESRLSKEKRPKYIIPFQKTKEDCKKEYMKFMRSAIFAPKELKQEKYIDSFRGIYMPYWLYSIKQQKKMRLDGTTDRRSGDYIITSHHDLRADLDVQYKGMAYDGSSSFADNISEKLAPFNVKKMYQFTPAYLSGFYADTADVPHSLYEDEVVKTATDRTLKFVEQEKEFKKYDISYTDAELSKKFGTEMDAVDRAMFPVWFLAYRNDDRVAYATVNGQTGKVVADLPVDIKKYLLGTWLISLPIFLFLNLFFTVTPLVLLSVVSVISAIVAILHAVEISRIVEKEGYTDDQGAMHVLKQNKEKREKEQWMQQPEIAVAIEQGMDVEAAWKNEYDKRKRAQKRKDNKKEKEAKKIPVFLQFIIIYCVISALIPMVGLGALFLPGDGTMVGVAGVAGLVSGIAFFSSLTKGKKLEKPDKCPKSICCVIAIIIVGLVGLINPVHDAYYYGVALLALVAIFLTLLDLIKKYNILATRKLPQFDYTGGDDHA